MPATTMRTMVVRPVPWSRAAGGGGVVDPVAVTTVVTLVLWPVASVTVRVTV
jgi:hypothetical protein